MRLIHLFAPAVIGSTINVAILNDIHMDPDYVQGELSELKEFIETSFIDFEGLGDFKNATESLMNTTFDVMEFIGNLSYVQDLGFYGKASPQALVSETASAMSDLHPTLDAILINGDSNRHGQALRAYENDTTRNTTWDEIKEI